MGQVAALAELAAGIAGAWAKRVRAAKIPARVPESFKYSALLGVGHAPPYPRVFVIVATPCQSLCFPAYCTFHHEPAPLATGKLLYLAAKRGSTSSSSPRGLMPCHVLTKAYLPANAAAYPYRGQYNSNLLSDRACRA